MFNDNEHNKIMNTQIGKDNILNFAHQLRSL